MNIVGTLNNFSSPTANSYKPSRDHQEENVVKEVEVESTFTNPYSLNGVDDTLWKAFTELSQPLDLYTQKYLEDRLFADADFATNWGEKVTNLRKELTRDYSSTELHGFVQEKNLILNQFNQPQMSPSDEKVFIEQIQRRTKQQATLLDGVLAVVEATAYKPLELAA